MLSQSLRNPVDQLKTPLNPAGFHVTLAPNVSHPIIPSHQATALRSGLLEGLGGLAVCRLRAVGSQGRLRIVGSWGDPREAILLVVLGCSPTTDSVKKNIVIGSKRKPSSGWAVELRRFFVNVLALFFVNVLALFFALFEIN